MTLIARRHLICGGAALAFLPGLTRAAAARLDVAYVNARVWTDGVDSAPLNAIGTIGTRIAAVGRDAVRAGIVDGTRVIDLEGAFVAPGFVDCHTHFARGSLALGGVDLRDAGSPAELARRIGRAAQVLPKGEWLQGGFWDADRWGGALPTRQLIDDVTPDTPVAVIRYDLHMLLCNSLALRLAGIDHNTPDVEGGVIERDARGEPTGVLKDAARALVRRVIPEPTPVQVDAALRRGIALALSKGITQTHCTEVDWTTHNGLRRLRAAGEPGIRFYSFVPLQDREKLAALIAREGRGDDWVRWGGCKVVHDGSLGSRTARFYEPYADDPSTRGIVVTTRQDMLAGIGEADRAGLQVSAHAIGDDANDTVLDVLAEIACINGRRDRRFRIEHAQHLSAAAIGRFAKEDVIASVQPYHAIDDGRWAVRRVGAERLQRTYAFHALEAARATVCMGSDWPVAPLDPVVGIAAAVVRETIDGKTPGGWYPEQRVSVTQALAGYTSNAAYAGFTDDRMGQIRPGYLADLVVLDRNPFEVEPHQLAKLRVLRTIVGGVQRFG